MVLKVIFERKIYCFWSKNAREPPVLSLTLTCSMVRLMSRYCPHRHRRVSEQRWSTSICKKLQTSFQKRPVALMVYVLQAGLHYTLLARALVGSLAPKRGTARYIDYFCIIAWDVSRWKTAGVVPYFIYVDLGFSTHGIWGASSEVFKLTLHMWVKPKYGAFHLHELTGNPTCKSSSAVDMFAARRRTCLLYSEQSALMKPPVLKRLKPAFTRTWHFIRNKNIGQTR